MEPFSVLQSLPRAGARLVSSSSDVVPVPPESRVARECSPKTGGRLLPRLNTTARPIANKYRESRQLTRRVEAAGGRTSLLRRVNCCSHGTLLRASVFEVLTRIFATTTKLCTGGGSSWVPALGHR
ncbi:hypothetical protein TNCT_737521 [Trichonephila clavata]|uniref:Uncharacterized protein n=1 Tax=Trichonephila clavata TaxID=2740835 RepID=A0A8X6H302_TRICU|nr:hypothetical protein TNCT_737521 [Trichonephila clavata]